MKTIPNEGHWLICRTDNLGDVLLTLPVAGFIKKHYPKSTISFLGQAYTAPVIKQCTFVDHFIDIADLKEKTLLEQVKFFKAQEFDISVHVFPNSKLSMIAYLSKIPIRLGTKRRWHQALALNEGVNLSRKQSKEHEAVLNIQLLEPVFGTACHVLQSQIPFLYGLKASEQSLPLELDARKKIILHPYSKGSARNWPEKHFIELINSLDSKKYQVMITGVEQERLLVEQNILSKVSETVVNLCGKLNLYQLMYLISQSDSFVSCSTGPLHIAAALGVQAIGIYPSLDGMDKKRWAPLGLKAQALQLKENCFDCLKDKNSCFCIEAITPKEIATLFEN